VFSRFIGGDLAGSRPKYAAPLDFSESIEAGIFFTPPYADFPALNLARRVARPGGTLPAVMNAANEIGVAAFLGGRRCAFRKSGTLLKNDQPSHGHCAPRSRCHILEKPNRGGAAMK